MVLDRLAGGLDAGVLSAVRWVSRRGRPPPTRQDPGGTLRALGQVAQDYPADAEAFHLAPPRIAPVETLVRGDEPGTPAKPAASASAGAPVILADGGRLLTLRWPSDAPPLRPGSRLRNDRHNRVAVARLYAHPTPRAAVVIIHGYAAGQWGVEARLWPIMALYAAGLDVAQIVLPFHGPRAHPERGGLPRFPSGNPRRTLEGFRQAMADVRGLMGWLRQRGAPRVGLWGMSLGGYTAALAASLSPTDCLVPVIPLASLVDYARERALFAPGNLGEAQAAALARVYRPIDPLARAPQVRPESVLTVVAQRDRITPPHHGRRLAAHFGGALFGWPGGHLVPFGRAEGWRRAVAHTAVHLLG
jgi:pimeloyl-ACP methyl ester carboxylesterase